MDTAEAKTNTDTRTCTCHPGNDRPLTCRRKFASLDCRVAELLSAVDHVIAWDNDHERRDEAMTGARLTFGDIRRLRRAADALSHWR